MEASLHSQKAGKENVGTKRKSLSAGTLMTVNRGEELPQLSPVAGRGVILKDHSVPQTVGATVSHETEDTDGFFWQKRQIGVSSIVIASGEESLTWHSYPDEAQ